ncbi:MAG: rod shape-determining protein MreD [bacterium]
MRQLAVFLFIYLLFVIQTAVLPFGPNFLLVALIIFALYENRLCATLIGLWAGLCLDLTNPTTSGIQMLALGSIGYGVAVIRTLFYRTRGHNIIFIFVALLLQYGLSYLGGRNQLQIYPILTTTALTIVLGPFAEPALTYLFYRHRKK